MKPIASQVAHIVNFLAMRLTFVGIIGLLLFSHYSFAGSIGQVCSQVFASAETARLNIPESVGPFSDVFLRRLGRIPTTEPYNKNGYINFESPEFVEVYRSISLESVDELDLSYNYRQQTRFGYDFFDRYPSLTLGYGLRGGPHEKPFLLVYRIPAVLLQYYRGGTPGLVVLRSNLRRLGLSSTANFLVSIARYEPKFAKEVRSELLRSKRLRWLSAKQIEELKQRADLSD